jgi:hypothetical protein
VESGESLFSGYDFAKLTEMIAVMALLSAPEDEAA